MNTTLTSTPSDVASQGATISVLFDPDSDLTERLNSEKEFQFVTKPTKEGKQDAEDGGAANGENPPLGGD